MRVIITAVLFISLTGPGCFFLSQTPETSSNADLKQKLDSVITRVAEEAYFDGQRDLLQGRQAIELNEEDSVYRWVKSPWLSGKTPIFQPTKKETKSDFKEE